jgi:23S rRNA pseudouridine2605 synthase
MMQRLQKLISAAGIASRRAAEDMILSGRITLNGETATLGMSADPDTDEVLVDGEPLTISRRRRYIVLHKPRGYVTTMKDDRDRPTVAELTKNAGGRLYPVGRLDMDSEGLLIMTDDGAVANALMHPRHRVNKVYTVFVQGQNIKASIQQLKKMNSLEGEPVSPPEVMLIELKGMGAELQITIHEGKNRQIRRMCKAAGLSVKRLIRIAEGPILLGELPQGQWRPMTKEEISFLQEITE